MLTSSNAISPEILLLDRVARGPSLLSQLAGGWSRACARFTKRIPRAGRPSPRALRVAAALILTVPLTTTAGAGILAWSAREEAAAFAEAAKARGLSRRRLDAVVAARAELERALARPTLGQSMAMLASELPRGTTIQRVARENDGAFTVVVVAGDPDGLRAALERSPALSTLSEVAQDGSETGGLRVTLRSFEL